MSPRAERRAAERSGEERRTDAEPEDTALWVEFAHIDACGLISTSPLFHSRMSPRAERRAAERSGAQRSGALRSERANE